MTRRLAAACLLAAGIVGALRWSVVQVAGGSMRPMLQPGDRLLTVPAVRPLLTVGTIVVVEDPRQAGHLVVKRLVRLSGDRAVVVGDTAGHSTDSRSLGAVPLTAIRRVVITRWPHVRSALVGAAADQPLPVHAWQAIHARR